MVEQFDDDMALSEQETEVAEARLQACQETIGTMGWRWFIAEVVREIDVIKEQLLTATGDEVRFLQGKADQCAQVVNFEDMVDNYLQLIRTEAEQGEDQE